MSGGGIFPKYRIERDGSERRCSANGDQLWQELAAALDEAGLRVTFDPERVACPACGARPSAECRPDCRLHGLSRLPELCDDCGGDERLCNCFMRYEERGEPAEETDDDDGID